MHNYDKCMILNFYKENRGFPNAWARVKWFSQKPEQFFFSSHFFILFGFTAVEIAVYC